MTVKVEIFYHADIPAIRQYGNWADLFAAEDYTYKAGDSFMINLGITVVFPPGYEALIVPRSSTFKNYGIIQTNSIGVVDQDYCGPKDIWRMPVYALRDGEIKKDSRVAQFRIISSMDAEIVETTNLGRISRGGFGSTGI